MSILAAAATAEHQPMALGVLLGIAIVLALAAMAWAWWVKPLNLALGLGTAVVMWTLTYVALLQPGFLVSEALFGAAVLAVVGGGYLAGRAGVEQASGLSVGLVSATFNTLMVGSALGGQKDGTPMTAVLYVGGLFAASALLGFVGHMLGARSRTPAQMVNAIPPNATLLMSAVTAAAIFVMVILGGLVTSMEAGLAVPDWPHTFGHNMLLYPVTQMKGGVFYEHAHRLFGTLVGVATLVTFATVFKTQSRAVPRLLVSLLLLLVIAQGVLGGLRVTGTVTTATDAAHLAPNKWYGVVHGVLAQVIFGIAAVLPLTVSRLWANAVPIQLARARSIRLLPTLALCTLFIQLVLGTAMRHLQERGLPTEGPQIPRWARDGHITMAVFVLVLVFAAGMRCGQVRELPTLQRNGKAAVHTVSLQILLGIFALVAILVRRGEAVPWWEVTAATAHQAVGALLLAVTAMLVAQSRRLVAPSLQART